MIAALILLTSQGASAQAAVSQARASPLLAAWHVQLPGSGIGGAAEPSQSQLGAVAPPVIPTSNPETRLVTLRVRGRTTGSGVVLHNRRILTSLSAIGRGLGISGRFADGAVERLRVVHTHRGFDLALLASTAINARSGLPLAVTDVVAAAAESDSNMLAALVWGARGPRLQPLKKRFLDSALGADGVRLSRALQARRRLMYGSPIVSTDGQLAGLVVAGCLEAKSGACASARVVIQAGDLQRFMQAVPVSDAPQGRLGLRGEAIDTGWVRGLRVNFVEKGSPADRLGLRAFSSGQVGDILIAINRLPIVNARRLRSILQSLAAGDEIELMVFREGRFERLSARLGAHSAAAGPWALDPQLIQAPTSWQDL